MCPSSWRPQSAEDAEETTRDVTVAYSTPGQWEELVYNVSELANMADVETAGFQRFVILPNFAPNTDRADNFPDETTDYYFDEVKFGSQGDCQQGPVSGIRAPPRRRRASLRPSRTPPPISSPCPSPRVLRRCWCTTDSAAEVIRQRAPLPAFGGATTRRWT